MPDDPSDDNYAKLTLSSQAFPGFEHFIGPKNKIITGQPYGGLTKREWFAGMALQGALSAGIGVTPPNGIHHPSDPELMAQASFKYADAMIKESKNAG